MPPLIITFTGVRENRQGRQHQATTAEPAAAAAAAAAGRAAAGGLSPVCDRTGADPRVRSAWARTEGLLLCLPGASRAACLTPPAAGAVQPHADRLMGCRLLAGAAEGSCGGWAAPARRWRAQLQRGAGGGMRPGGSGRQMGGWDSSLQHLDTLWRRVRGQLGPCGSALLPPCR